MIRRPSFDRKICSNCGATAKYVCRDCGKPLCGRCRSRKPIFGIGLCKQCIQVRTFNTTVVSGVFVVKAIQRLKEHIDSKTKREPR